MQCIAPYMSVYFEYWQWPGRAGQLVFHGPPNANHVDGVWVSKRCSVSGTAAPLRAVETDGQFPMIYCFGNEGGGSTVELRKREGAAARAAQGAHKQKNNKRHATPRPTALPVCTERWPILLFRSYFLCAGSILCAPRHSILHHRTIVPTCGVR